VTFTSADHVAILDVIAAYCHCYDSRDARGLAEVFAPDATVILRIGTETVFDGREAVLTWLTGGWGSGPVCMHLTGNVRVRPDGGEATSVADYLFAIESPAGGIELRQAGRYIDRFVRSGDHWVIRSRTITALGGASGREP
jgi:hypothetical protein